MTKSKIYEIAFRADYESFNDGQLIRFDTRLLTGDYTTIELFHPNTFGFIPVAQELLAHKLMRELS